MKKLSFLVPVFIRLIPFLFVITVSCLFVYAAVQQNYRQGANDPQIQIAEDISTFLASGGKPGEVLNQSSQVDISKSLAPFVAIYDDTGKLIGTSGFLHGQAISIPAGVLAYAKKDSENRVTWQPEKGVRSATVSVYYSTDKNKGYVVVGRSLREVEKREAKLCRMTFLAWIGSIVLTFFALAITTRPKKLETNTTTLS